MSGVTLSGLGDHVGRYLSSRGIDARAVVRTIVVDSERRGLARVAAKYEVAPPDSHGSWEPGYFGDDRLDFCTAAFSYPSLGLGGCGNSQMGPERRWEFRDDLGWTVL